MGNESFFKKFVESSAQRVGLFGLSRDGGPDKLGFSGTCKISKNVLTDFDGKLSRYLAAVHGIGLPGASIETRIHGAPGEDLPSCYPVTYVQSFPDALVTAARLALGGTEKTHLRIGAWINDAIGSGRDWVITNETIETLECALAVCQRLGTIDFLEVSGSFERLIVRPIDSDLEMMTIDLRLGTIDVPEAGAARGSAWTGPLFSFEKATTQVPALINYLSRAQHEVFVAKERAILNFREAAEAQIMSFNAALAGRPLTDHRLEYATSLVGRLKKGLGPDLAGISAAAQMTALDWVDGLDEAARPYRAFAS